MPTPLPAIQENLRVSVEELLIETITSAQRLRRSFALSEKAPLQVDRVIAQLQTANLLLHNLQWPSTDCESPFPAIIQSDIHNHFADGFEIPGEHQPTPPAPTDQYPPTPTAPTELPPLP